MRICMRCGERFLEFLKDGSELKELGLDIFCEDCLIVIVGGLMEDQKYEYESAKEATTVPEHIQ